MYCPKCGTDYRKGFLRCSDCGVDLVPEQAPESDRPSESNLVVIKTYSSRHEAELGKGVLAVDGIDAVIFADDYGGVNPGLSFSTGVRLLVREEDAEKALDIFSAEDET